VHSRIRRALFGADEPTFSGLIAWRGVIPMAALPRHMARMVGTNWVGPGGHVVHYPLRRGELMNFVGIVERGDWQIESWSTRGSAEEEAASDFAGWHNDVHDLIRNAPALFKWALMVREPMERWTMGPVTLLGDACHPTLPMLAQGAVMAIEDGFILARCLERWPDDIAAALLRYEGARLERTRNMVLGSAANAERFHNRALADPVRAKNISTASGAARRSPAATSGCSPTMSSAPKSELDFMQVWKKCGARSLTQRSSARASTSASAGSLDSHSG
jgi:2-polyprenyl-6-methoxyphenol hydroxylase-like FAD-dependent oxidoreductase